MWHEINEHGFQSTNGDKNDLQQMKYGDNDHNMDISDQTVLANRTKQYQGYEDACGNKIIMEAILSPMTTLQRYLGNIHSLWFWKFSLDTQMPS